ncbi:MAG: four helix bundle protein [Planctomycetota bacterium]|nr:four helix bundle protein [Planctomycetota bacterium]
MAKIQGFKDLIAWQKAVELAVLVYRLTAEFPAEERFGLAAHARRSAVSIPSNIAEGFSRTSRPDFARFLELALGSANELETQLTLAIRLGFLTPQKAQACLGSVTEVQRVTVGLMNSLTKSPTTKVSR